MLEKTKLRILKRKSWDLKWQDRASSKKPKPDMAKHEARKMLLNIINQKIEQMEGNKCIETIKKS